MVLTEIRYKFFKADGSNQIIEQKTFFSTRQGALGTQHCDAQARLHATWLSTELGAPVNHQHRLLITSKLNDD